MQKMRNCVINSGYSAQDLVRMFQAVDGNADGVLDFSEFTSMLETFQIPVTSQVAAEVFETFDHDAGGVIEYIELLRGLFPKTYRLINRRHSQSDGVRDCEINAEAK